MSSNKLKWLLFLFLILHPLPAASQIYITWQGLEPDKLASLWLIKRFVDQEAEFKLVPKGSLIKDGIPFDVPSATFKRSHTRSTFECVLQNEGLDDERRPHSNAHTPGPPLNVYYRTRAWMMNDYSFSEKLFTT